MPRARLFYTEGVCRQEGAPNSIALEAHLRNPAHSPSVVLVFFPETLDVIPLMDTLIQCPDLKWAVLGAPTALREWQAALSEDDVRSTLALLTTPIRLSGVTSPFNAAILASANLQNPPCHVPDESSTQTLSTSETFIQDPSRQSLANIMAVSPDPTHDGSDLPAPGPWSRSDFRRLATLVIPKADPPLLSRIAHALVTSSQTKQPTYCQYSIRLLPTLIDHSENHRSSAVQALCQFAFNEDANIISAARGAMSLLLHTRPAATAIHILRFHRLLCYTEQTRTPELLSEWINRASSIARAIPTDMDTWERSTEAALQLDRTIPHLHSTQNGFLAWGPQTADLTAPTRLTIVSWNANSFRARYNNGDLARLLADTKPHILLIQEMKMPCSDNDGKPLASFCETQALMVNLGYCHGAVHWSTDTNGPHHNGVAIFSKFPCTFRPGLYGCAMPSTFDDQGRALTATFTEGIITNFYAPTTHNDTSRDECRQQWDKDLCSHILSLTSQAQVIAGGDWNVAPDPTFDSTIRQRSTEGPDPGTKQFETEAHCHLLATSELRNCFHSFHNEKRLAQENGGEHLTWFKSERDQRRGIGKALDHFLASPSMFDNPHSEKGLRVQECSIIRSTYHSDHRPIKLILANGSISDRTAPSVHLPHREPPSRGAYAQLNNTRVVVTYTRKSAEGTYLCGVCDSEGTVTKDVLLDHLGPAPPEFTLHPEIPLQAPGPTKPSPRPNPRNFPPQTACSHEDFCTIHALHSGIFQAQTAPRTGPELPPDTAFPCPLHDALSFHPNPNAVCSCACRVWLQNCNSFDQPDTNPTCTECSIQGLCAKAQQKAASMTEQANMADIGPGGDPNVPNLQHYLNQPRRRLTPTTTILAGDKRTPSSILIDTGASRNLVTMATAHAVGARFHRVPKEQTLAFLGVHNTSQYALGLCSFPLHIQGVDVHRYYWILQDMPHPIILGSEFLGDFNAAIQYNGTTTRLTLNLTGGGTINIDATDNDSSPRPHQFIMTAASTVTIAPFSTAMVPISPPMDTGACPDGTQGYLDDANMVGVKVYSGVAHFQGRDSPKVNLCLVRNDTGLTHTISKGKPVATFTTLTDEILVCDDFDPIAVLAEDIFQRKATANDPSLAHICREESQDPSERARNTEAILTALSDIAATLTSVETQAREIHLYQRSRLTAALATESPSSATTARPLGVVNEAIASVGAIKHLAALDLSGLRDFYCKGELDVDDVVNFCAHVIKHQRLWHEIAKTPCPTSIPAKIEVTAQPKITARTIPINPEVRKQLRELLDTQRKLGIIEPSNSPFTSSVLLVPKPGGKIRFVVDYRALNKFVVNDSHPLPRVDETLSALHGAAVFSTFDLVSAFWQVPLTEDSKAYTAFRTPEGCNQYTRLPMGLKTASAIFCRFIDNILGDLKWNSCMSYIDDVLSYSKGAKDHCRDTCSLITRLDDSNLTANAPKTKLFRPSVAFLGHSVSASGIRPDPDKVKAIVEMQHPSTPAELLSHLNLFGHYRKFIMNFSAVTRCLYDKAKQQRFNGDWTQEELEAYKRVKDIITSDTVVHHPDWSKQFEVHTDASKYGLGAMLVQIIDGTERVIAYASRMLTTAEGPYSPWEKEALGAVWATRTFRMYLLGQNFTIVTDSSWVQQLLDKPPNHAGGRTLRWKMSLEEFSYTIRHRPGKLNVVADALSRFPVPTECTQGIAPALSDPFDYSMMSVLAATDIWHRHRGTLGPECTSEGCCTEPIDATPAIEHKSTKGFFQEGDSQAWSSADIIFEQKASPYCQSIQALTPAKFEAAFFFDTSGVLRRRLKFSGGDTGPIVVPHSLRAFYLHRHHTLPVAGHRGQKRTWALLKKRVWWHGVRADLRRWIKACLICCRRKPPRPTHSTRPGVVCNSPHPFHTLSVDIVTVDEGEESEDGFKYILTCIDTFTRWVITVPLKETSAQTIAQALFDHVFCQKGVSKRLLSDEGSNFLAPAVVHLCERFQIDKISTGAYCQHANPVERFHRVLNSTMTAMTTRFGRLWSRFLQAATFVYNCSTNESTGYSPYYLCYGHEPTLLEDIAWDEAAMKPWPNLAAYQKDVSNRMFVAYEQVVRQQAKIATRNQLIANGLARHVSFEVKDEVLFWEPSNTPFVPSAEDPSKAAKGHLHIRWKNNWSGPHTVTGRTRSDGTHDYSYTIHHRDRVVNVDNIRANRLMLFNPWSEELPSTSYEFDPARGYQIGGLPTIGEFVVTPARAPYPFIVGKVINYTADGSIKIHQYGNPKGTHRASFHPAWIRNITDTIAVFEAEAPHVSWHRRQFNIRRSDITIRGFQLTPIGKNIPRHILRAISASASIPWTLPPSALGH